MTSRQIERVINKNYRNWMRNLSVGINGYEWLILRKNNVLNINPPFWNSKYAFLFPFSILPNCWWKLNSVRVYHFPTNIFYTPFLMKFHVWFRWRRPATMPSSKKDLYIAQSMSGLNDHSKLPAKMTTNNPKMLVQCWLINSLKTGFITLVTVRF